MVKLKMDNKIIWAEVAESAQARTQGLSGRKSLAPNKGLLFIFSTPGYYRFWMKEMNFPIDIVWLDQNWRIVDLTENLSPVSYPQTFTSIDPAQYVLELKAGQSKNLGLKIGDLVKVNN